MEMIQDDLEPRVRRGAALKGAAATAEQLAPTPPESPIKAPPDADPFGSPGSSSKRKPLIQYKSKHGATRTKAGPPKSTGVSATPITPVHRSSQKTGRKRALSDSDGMSSSEESALTPLPSSVKPSRSTGKRKATKVPEPETPSRRRVDSTSGGNLQRKRLKHKQSTPAISARNHGHQPAVAHSSPTKGPDLNSTNGIRRMGDRVWLRICVESKALAEDVSEKDELGPQTMWWPGHISQSRPLQITLSHGSGVSGPIDVPKPSPHILCDIATTSFTSSTFLVPPTCTLANGAGIQSSPRKKHKTDLLTNWQSAVDAMTVVDDELDLLEELLPFSQPSPKADREEAEVDVTNEMDIDLLDLLEPPAADGFLTIPGQGVLSKETENAKYYWPAQILKYLPPKKPGKKGHYLVKFLDRTEKKVPRGWFYDDTQDEFATCQLGDFVSENPEVEADTEHDLQLDRGPSPTPLDPPPSTEDFERLTIREELAYVKPILSAILMNSYVPARERHNGYLKGGKARSTLAASAGARGTISVREVEALDGYIRRWAVRKVIHGQTVDLQEACLDGEGLESASRKGSPPAPSASLTITRSSSPPEAPPSSYAATSVEDLDKPATSIHDHPLHDISPDVDIIISAPQGCEAYNNLPLIDKLGYCQNILLPEAVRQVLLWRNGKRTSWHLLSDAQEDELHRIGDELLNATDWVRDIMRLRESMVRTALKKKPTTPDASEPISGTRSRPNRAAVKYR
ncbi:hypothetical protein FIBSPDRAFT_1051088 [Athelia psychrophila]|uniref:PWWP domain-containing protein n=1 Tax=Athelia psychrophila TaxID=1759441 RepID=A0A165ZSG1_9AGAM|nr:hypothetical protein FIBSPDRAFT_1051088 [Fibularhizoctonia sp. CBS 109695]